MLCILVSSTLTWISNKLAHGYEDRPGLRRDDCDIAECQIDPDSSLSYEPPSLADETNIDCASKVDKCRHSVRFPGVLTSEESKPEGTHHHETLASDDRQESKNFIVNSVTPESSISVDGRRDWQVLLVLV